MTPAQPDQFTASQIPPMPDFRDASAIRQHIAETLAFYHPRCIDTSGGFYHFFRDDGSVYDAKQRHLVSSTRFIFVYARAYREFADPAYLQALRHGLQFLRDVHFANGSYAWLLHWQDGRKQILDETNHCYGLAFVLLAYAHALMAGIEEARGYLQETFAIMEQRFWQQEFGLYADQADANWVVQPYRGQNANMHACEAMLAAFDATGHAHFLLRAEELARNICQRQAQRCGGLLWEHYDSQWQVDWEYNRADPANLFRPWGYQPGHLTEWAKLLLLLEQRLASLAQPDASETAWLLPCAEDFFQAAMQHAWDTEYGGICYGFAPDLQICDGDKYFWVQAESLACAAMLAARTGKNVYWQQYQAIWEYSWQHMIDHQHGAWFRILRRDNSKISNEKSPAGKTDYHTMGACYEIIG